MIRIPIGLIVMYPHDRAPPAGWRVYNPHYVFQSFVGQLIQHVGGVQ